MKTKKKDRFTHDPSKYPIKSASVHNNYAHFRKVCADLNPGHMCTLICTPQIVVARSHYKLNGTKGNLTYPFTRNCNYYHTRSKNYPSLWEFGLFHVYNLYGDDFVIRWIQLPSIMLLSFVLGVCLRDGI